MAKNDLWQWADTKRCVDDQGRVFWRHEYRQAGNPRPMIKEQYTPYRETSDGIVYLQQDELETCDCCGKQKPDVFDLLYRGNVVLRSCTDCNPQDN